MNKTRTEIHYNCSNCSKLWIMVNQEKSKVWCPHCGFSTTTKESLEIEIIEDEIQLVKEEKILVGEDKRTSNRCLDGWWNPITDKCMGNGTGFNPSKT